MLAKRANADQRALAVRGCLTRRGVHNTLINIVSNSEHNPIGTNRASDSCNAKGLATRDGAYPQPIILRCQYDKNNGRAYLSP